MICIWYLCREDYCSWIIVGKRITAQKWSNSLRLQFSSRSGKYREATVILSADRCNLVLRAFILNAHAYFWQVQHKYQNWFKKTLDDQKIIESEFLHFATSRRRSTDKRDRCVYCTKVRSILRKITFRCFYTYFVKC